MAHTISFQYMAADDPEPRADYEITNRKIDLPAGAAVPRVGEFVQILHRDGVFSYVVRAVHTQIALYLPDQTSFHSVITVGPESEVEDRRLLVIRQ